MLLLLRIRMLMQLGSAYGGQDLFEPQIAADHLALS